MLSPVIFCTITLMQFQTPPPPIPPRSLERCPLPSGADGGDFEDPHVWEVQRAGDFDSHTDSQPAPHPLQSVVSSCCKPLIGPLYVRLSITGKCLPIMTRGKKLIFLITAQQPH